jgi:hypothetical protein
VPPGKRSGDSFLDGLPEFRRQSGGLQQKLGARGVGRVHVGDGARSGALASDRILDDEGPLQSGERVLLAEFAG